jgi:hypothetical protein
VHPDAQGLAAQDRWITWAVLVSLLLHTPLFLSSGIWRRGLLDGTAAPPLLVHIEPSELPENTQAEGVPVVVEEHAIPPDEAAPAPAIEPGDLPLETINEDTGDTESSLEAGTPSGRMTYQGSSTRCSPKQVRIAWNRFRDQSSSPRVSP